MTAQAIPDRIEIAGRIITIEAVRCRAKKQHQFSYQYRCRELWWKGGNSLERYVNGTRLAYCPDHAGSLARIRSAASERVEAISRYEKRLADGGARLRLERASPKMLEALRAIRSAAAKAKPPGELAQASNWMSPGLARQIGDLAGAAIKAAEEGDGEEVTHLPPRLQVEEGQDGEAEGA